MSTKKQNPESYQPPVALGASNEELIEKQRIYDEKVARGEIHRVSVTSHREDKQIDGDGDPNFDTSFDPEIEGDLMKASLRGHQIPGMSYKLLSERCINHFGGTGGYQVLKAKNGDPVRIGNMIWGEMPTARADKRQRGLEKKDRESITNIQNDYAQKVADLKLQARDYGLQVLGAGDNVRNVGDGDDYDMGIRVERGPMPRE